MARGKGRKKGPSSPARQEKEVLLTPRPKKRLPTPDFELVGVKGKDKYYDTVSGNVLSGKMARKFFASGEAVRASTHRATSLDQARQLTNRDLIYNQRLLVEFIQHQRTQGRNYSLETAKQSRRWRDILIGLQVDTSDQKGLKYDELNREQKSRRNQKNAALYELGRKPGDDRSNPGESDSTRL